MVDISSLILLINVNDTFGFGERQTAQKQVVDQTEDRGVHSDADREREDRESGERRRLEELANGEAEIVHVQKFSVAAFAWRVPGRAVRLQTICVEVFVEPLTSKQ